MATTPTGKVFFREIQRIQSAEPEKITPARILSFNLVAAGSGRKRRNKRRLAAAETEAGALPASCDEDQVDRENSSWGAHASPPKRQKLVNKSPAPETANQDQLLDLLEARFLSLLGKKKCRKTLQGLLKDGGLSEMLTSFNETQLGEPFSFYSIEIETLSSCVLKPSSSLGNLVHSLIRVLFQGRERDERVTRHQLAQNLVASYGWKMKLAKLSILRTFRRIVEEAERQEAREEKEKAGVASEKQTLGSQLVHGFVKSSLLIKLLKLKKMI